MNIKEYAITEWNSIGINFWNISKCAGTSIKHALLAKEGLLDKVDFSKHKSIHNNKYIKYITKNEANTNNNKNIAVIRHPYDRVVSLYRDFHLKRKQSIPVYDRKVDIDKINDFDYFIKIYIDQGSDKDNIHLRSLSWSLCEKNNILVDKIYHFSDVEKLFFDYNLEYVHRNKSFIAEIKLTDLHKKSIQNRYQEDFENFGFDNG